MIDNTNLLVTQSLSFKALKDECDNLHNKITNLEKDIETGFEIVEVVFKELLSKLDLEIVGEDKDDFKIIKKGEDEQL